MHRTKSTTLGSLAVASLLGFGASGPSHAADFKAAGYDTPAYVDLDVSEIHVHEPAATVAINILRTGDFRQTTTIEYQTVEDDASEGQDYKGAGGTLVFRPGEGFKTILVEIVRDDQDEPLESFRVELSSSDPNCMLMRSSALIVIEDQPVPIARPELKIAAAGAGKILLSWDGSDTCALERTATPAAGNWEPVECSPLANGNRSEVVQPIGGTYFFYRLRVR
jgi:hypothetical protein